MDTLSLLTRFLSTILVICTGFSKADRNSQHFTIHVGQKFKPELDHFEGEVINMMQCAAMCTLDANCTSASFHDVFGTCRLSEVHVHEPNGGQEMIVDPQWSALSTNDHNSIYWIALKSGQGNDTFVWNSDGQIPIYTMWHNVGEPQIIEDPNCVALYLSFDGNEYRWKDDNCLLQHRVVCQAGWLA